MRAPRVLDLFSGAGGAAMGLHRAWPDAEITGVDIRPMPRYPFRHVVADAMTYPLDGFDFVWASPPCQAYSRATVQQRARGVIYPDLLAATRRLLQASGLPYVIENVPLAAMDGCTAILCGQMFGLRVLRHRLFETSWLAFQPHHWSHVGLVRGVGNDFVCAVTNAYKKAEYRDDTLEVWREALGIEWMTKRELSEAIPPAYSEYLARQYGPLGCFERAS